MLVNETLAKAPGYKDSESAPGDRILFTSWFGDISGEIAGVVKDYHQRSLKDKHAPILYYYNNRSGWNYYSMRLKTTDISTILPFI